MARTTDPRLSSEWLLPLALLWAAPWTLVGIVCGLIGCATGGKARVVGRTVEFYGGVVDWMLRHVPIVGGGAAMTVGHVILGRNRQCLDHCRDHELVHVRQYERWGPFFVPAYFLASLVCWWAGRDPYRDNPFEREAFDNARTGNGQ